MIGTIYGQLLALEKLILIEFRIFLLPILIIRGELWLTIQGFLLKLHAKTFSS